MRRKSATVDQSTVAMLLRVAIPVLSASAVAFTFGNRMRSADDCVALGLPGWAVGAVWTVHLGTLGYVVHRLGQGAPATRLYVVLLGLFCLAYPLYSSEANQFGVATLTLGLATAGMLLVHRAGGARAAAYMGPLVAWLMYVTHATRPCAQQHGVIG